MRKRSLYREMRRDDASRTDAASMLREMYATRDAASMLREMLLVS